MLRNKFRFLVSAARQVDYQSAPKRGRDDGPKRDWAGQKFWE